MPAGSGAMAGFAASQAAIAVHKAHEAEVAQCKIVLSHFQSQEATIEEMQQYAHCVDVVYPQPISDGTEIIFKALFVIALIGIGAGALWTKTNTAYANFSDYVLGVLIGFLGLPVAVSAAFGLLYGIYWLFT